MSDMITRMVSINILESTKEMPKYGAETPLLKITNILIVKRGTVEGNPTADIQLVDENGKTFVVMVNGSILEGIGGAVGAARIMSAN